MRNATAIILASIGFGLCHSGAMAQEPTSAPPQSQEIAQAPGGPMGDQPPMAWMPPLPHAFGNRPAAMLPPPPRGGLHLAGALSSMETLIGIKSNQLDAWRDYSSAVLAFLQPPTQDRMQRPQPADFNGRSDEKPMMDMMADAAIARGNAAARVKVTLEALTKILTPEQIRLLASSERDLLRGPPQGFPFGHPAPRDDAGFAPMPGDQHQP